MDIKIQFRFCAKNQHRLLTMGTGQNSFENYLEKFDTICVPSNFIFQTLREHGFDNVELVKHPMALPSLTPEFFNVTGTLKILFYFD